jgi:hypothetical protein
LAAQTKKPLGQGKREEGMLIQKKKDFATKELN